MRELRDQERALAPPELKVQRYFCENCSTHGAVAYVDDEDVKAVADRVSERHRLYSPDCGFPMIRILIGKN